jgi:AraC-like DNA-binding protein
VPQIPQDITASRPTKSPTIRRFFIDNILIALEDRGLKARHLLAKYGLNNSKNAHPYSTVSLKSYVAFLEELAVESNSPSLGFDLGKSFGPWEIGPVYPLLATAPTLRESLRIFSEFQETWQSQTTMRVEMGGGAERYVYAIDNASVWPRVQDTEYVLACICSLIRHLSGKRWTPTQVMFEHDVADRRELLSDFFQCPIVCNAPHNAIGLESAELDRALNNWLPSSEFVRQTFGSHLSELLRPAEVAHKNFPDELADLISLRFGGGDLHLESLAFAIDLTPRTLRRRLKEFGTSFSAILEAERRKKAAQLLVQNISLDQLASHLGYASQAAFSRAFRDWTGQSPGVARVNARSESSGRRRAP